MMEHLARSRQELEAYNLSLLRRNRELSTLYAISRAVAGPLRLTEVLERGLDQTMNLVHAAGGWICKLGEDSSCRVSVDTWQGPSQPDVGLDNCRQCPTCLEVRKTRQLLVVGSFPPNCPLRAAGDGNGIPPACHVAVPLLVREQVVGLLGLVCEEQDCFEAEDLDLLEAVGRQLGIAVENARLWEEVRRKEAMRGELLRKIITAQEEERQRIAWELHDETGQTLTSLLVNLRVMERANSVKEVRTLIPDMREVLVQTLDEVHHLALELRPSVLDDLGLVPALTRYAQDCPARFGLEVDFVTAGLSNQRLPLQIETTLYRVAQEALTNVARHSGARHVSVLLERRGGSVVLVVEDDGRGFDVTQMMTSAQKRKPLGLYGMEERASLVGGRLTIESEADVGTTVSVEIPLEVAWLGKEIRTP
jgi:signal transduction histidine kinase